MRWVLSAPEREALARTVRMLNVKRGAFWLSVLYGVAGLGSAIGLAAVSAWLIARASQMPPVLYLSIAATSVRMFGVLRALLRYLQRLASHRVALDGMDSLRLAVYDDVMSGPIEQVAQLQRGDLLGRIGADIDAVGDYVVKSLLPFVTVAIVAVGTVIGFAFLSIPAAAVMAVGLFVSAVISPLLVARSARESEALEQDAKRTLSVQALSMLEDADELAVEQRLEDAFERLDTTSKDLDRARAKAARPAAFGVGLDRLAMGLTVVGVLVVAIPETNMGYVAAVALAVLVLTPLAAFEGTSELGEAAVQLVRSARAAKRITDLVGAPSRDSTPHAVPQEFRADPASSPNLSAVDLTVGWPGRPPAVTGINMDLAPGQVTAIVGPSGIGKSTLLYTLAGMLEAVDGEATLNGVPVWNADRSQVTDKVSLTTEDAHIFATTVFENIRVARSNVTRAEATEFLNTVGLGDWLEGLPQGLDTMLGSFATTISGGERRRLLLARALATGAPLLLLDEPGEHLDSETAEQIMRALLQGASEERGLLIVTHQLFTLGDSTQVIRLEAQPGSPAKIVSAGTHRELMEQDASYRWAAHQERE